MTSIEEWDRWFEVVKDEESTRAWCAVKKIHTGDTKTLDWWATLIELNRLDRLAERSKVQT